jgi:LmbE family N-acetylglucosaminyl deacetylase
MSDSELESEITKDIQALLASYGDKTIDVYGPSIFTPTITHADHALLHRAFLNVAKDYAKNTASFYFYEDFPYVARFNKESVISLEKNLENDSGMIFDKTTIMLSPNDVRAKENALERYASQSEAFKAGEQDIVNDSTNYTNTRCEDTACEVVYKLFKI